MELARGEAGENTAAVSADGKGGFAARLKALVLGRWSSQSAAGNASGAGGRVEGLSVGQSAEGRTEAELERARLRELKLRR
jgi:hypothetical protein